MSKENPLGALFEHSPVIREIADKLGIEHEGDPLYRVVENIISEIDHVWDLLRDFDHTGREEPLSSCVEVVLTAYEFAKGRNQ